MCANWRSVTHSFSKPREEIDVKEPIDTLRSGIEASIAVKRLMLADASLLRRVVEVAALMTAAVKRGNRVIFAGNGGSAADAQHFAAEFVSSYDFDRPGLPALSLATDTSMLTAIGNDYGYDNVFKRQLEAQARPGDVFVGITTSGRSKNVLAAFGACRSLEVTSVALCGQGGELEGRVDHLIRVPSGSTPRIQEAHITLGHMMCQHVELQLFAHLKPSADS
jgi:D-sedoheptulose 7-phosphate isomerase